MTDKVQSEFFEQLSDSQRSKISLHTQQQQDIAELFSKLFHKYIMRIKPSSCMKPSQFKQMLQDAHILAEKKPKLPQGIDEYCIIGNADADIIYHKARSKNESMGLTEQSFVIAMFLLSQQLYNKSDLMHLTIQTTNGHLTRASKSSQRIACRLL